MHCWIDDSATGGSDDKINPPAADHYSIIGANSEVPKKPLYSQSIVEIPRRLNTVIIVDIVVIGDFQ